MTEINPQTCRLGCARVSTSPEKTWRIDQVSWTEARVEAFAGMHNEGRRILVVFDAGSAIPEIIYETTEGALTDANTEIIWLQCCHACDISWVARFLQNVQITARSCECAICPLFWKDAPSALH
jgi:hypothetical protein